MTMMPDDERLVRELEDAVADLWWMSETDAPFEVFCWEHAFQAGFTIPELIKLTEHDEALSVQVMAVDDFFAPAIRLRDWYGDAELEDVRRYRHLKAWIQTSLVAPCVYRVGDTVLDIYILGQTPYQSWMGLTTQAVET